MANEASKADVGSYFFWVWVLIYAFEHKKWAAIPGTNVLWVYRVTPKPGRRSQMEDTQDLSACVTKFQESVLRWERRLQSEPGEPAAFRQAVAPCVRLVVG